MDNLKDFLIEIKANNYNCKEYSSDMLKLLDRINKIKSLNELNKHEITNVISNQNIGFYKHAMNLIIISLKFYHNFEDLNNGTYKYIISYFVI